MELNIFEEKCFSDFSNGHPSFQDEENQSKRQLGFGLWVLFEIGKLIRTKRINPVELNHKLKNDQTPVTPFEQEIEDFVSSNLNNYLPHIKFIGEESGGELQKEGFVLSIDPLDSTWSFLSHSETGSTSIAIFEDSVAVIGIVMNSSTGEIAYVINGEKTRLIQLPFWGDNALATDLPTNIGEDRDKILINIHPSKKSDKIIQSCYEQWKEGKIRLVKSSSGSPSWALLEASKGYFSYINLWGRSPAKSYDLAAGILLVRGAGGDVVDMTGTPIPYVGHIGPFIASANKKNLEKILEFI